MIVRLVIFLIRLRLGVKKNEIFKFINQKTPSVYYFTATSLLKIEDGLVMKSKVNLNWLLDKECKIKSLRMVRVYEDRYTSTKTVS